MCLIHSFGLCIVYGRSDSLWIATNPQWLEPPWVYLDSGNQASIINGTQLYRDIYGGFPTLKSGRSTGTDYGTVVIANYSPSYVPRSNPLLPSPTIPWAEIVAARLSTTILPSESCLVSRHKAKVS